MTAFFIITMCIVTLYTISIIGQYETPTKVTLICAAINLAYIAACIYFTTRGI